MSSMLLPKVDSSRSHMSFSFIIFVVLTILLSTSLGVPDFTSITVISGLVIITLLITSIFSALNAITWMRVFVCGVKAESNDWMGRDREYLINSPAFQRLSDRETSHFLLGISLLFLSFLVVSYGYEIFVSLFGLTYKQNVLSNDLEFFKFQAGIIEIVFSAIFLIIGTIISYKAFRSGRKLESLIWDLILLIRIRRLPRSLHGSTVDSWIKWLEYLLQFVKDNDFLILHYELEAEFFIGARIEFERFIKSIEDFNNAQENIKKEEITGWGYPDLILEVNTITQTKNFSSNYINMKGKAKHLNLPMSRDLPIINLFFSSNSQIIQLTKNLNLEIRKLQFLDSLLFRVSHIFLIIACNISSQSFLIDSEGSHPLIEEFQLDFRKSSKEKKKENTLLSIIFSTWFVKNAFQIDGKYLNISFKENFFKTIEFKDVKPSKKALEVLNDYSSRILSEDKNSKTTLSVNISSQPVKYLLEDIKEIQESGVTQKGQRFLPNDLPLEDIVKLLENDSFKKILNELQKLRRISVEALLKTIKDLDDRFRSLPKNPCFKLI